MVASRLKPCLIVAGLLLWNISGAQTGVNGDKTVFSASLASNSIRYFEDSEIGDCPEDMFGSNNYLKMDYSMGRFSAGMQLEAYLPALYGFEIGQQADPKKFWLASKYIRWSSDAFTVQAGDIYEQLGNGLVFRSYEDRNLGFNNSLEGVHAVFSPNGWFSVKGFAGRPRLYTDYAGSLVRAANLQFSLSGLLGWNDVLLNIEGSCLNRHETLDKDQTMDFASLGVTSPDVNMYSGAVDFNWRGLALKGEYAVKGNDLASMSEPKSHTGAALLTEAVYAGGGFSASASFRIIDHFGTMLSLYGRGTGNTLNYLPSLTRQYHYMLANLNPYQVNVVGEGAGQADLFYTLRSKASRSKYWVFHANWSTSYTIDPKQCDDGSQRLMWQDISADAECHWNRSLKTVFLFSRQEWSPSHGYQEGTYVSNVFVGDIQYRFNRKFALRGELQYLQSDDYEGDWAACLVECTLAPNWNVYVSEMYNAGLTKKHYYNAGVSWSKGVTRVQFSYGRNRAGYVCSGGVCRYSPAYTGLNLLFTTAF